MGWRRCSDGVRAGASLRRCAGGELGGDDAAFFRGHPRNIGRPHVAAFVDRDFARETQFLAELAKTPSDNPPGDCAAVTEAARPRMR
jgi:hypothetical protein